MLPTSNHVHYGHHIPYPMLPKPTQYNATTCFQYNTRKPIVFNDHTISIRTDKHCRFEIRLVERRYRNQRLYSDKNKTNGKDTKGVKNGQACETGNNKGTYYNKKLSFLSIELSKLFKNPKPNQNNFRYQLQTKRLLLQKQSGQSSPLRWPRKKLGNRRNISLPHSKNTRNSCTKLPQQFHSKNKLPRDRQLEEHHEETHSQQVNTKPQIYVKNHLLIPCSCL
jgi:hypothetical protein